MKGMLSDGDRVVRENPLPAIADRGFGMDPRSEQIVKHIQQKRDPLGDNLAELQTRVREAVNWRTYFFRNPWAMIGASALAGYLPSSLFIPRRR